MIVKDGQWQHLINDKINIKHISNLGIKYSEALVSELRNPFWKDVIKSYVMVLKSTINITDYSLPTNVLKVPVYFNQNIMIGHNVIFFKKYYDNGLFLINDFINKNGKMYTCEELNFIYNIKMNFLQYHGIKKAIQVYLNKNNILDLTSKLQYPIIPANIQLLLKHKKAQRICMRLLTQTRVCQQRNLNGI